MRVYFSNTPPDPNIDQIYGFGTVLSGFGVGFGVAGGFAGLFADEVFEFAGADTFAFVFEFALVFAFALLFDFGLPT